MRDLNSTVPSLDPSFVSTSGVTDFKLSDDSMPVFDINITDSRTLCESSLTKS